MKTFVAILVSLLFISDQYSVNKTFTNSQNSWELAKHENNIKVYTRQPENSPIKEFKVVSELSCGTKPLEELIDKVEEYPKWQANVEIAKMLKKVSESEQYIYYTTDVPWPISDRDMIINCKKTISSLGVITYKLESHPKFINEFKGYVRLIDARGKWEFTPLKNGKTKVVYQFYGDPNGSIPSWIINIFIIDGPFTTFSNLKKLVEK